MLHHILVVVKNEYLQGSPVHIAIITIHCINSCFYRAVQYIATPAIFDGALLPSVMLIGV